MNHAKKGKNSSLTSVFQKTEFTLGIIIVALFIVATVGTDNFCTVYNITNLMKQCAIIGVLAVAQTMIIITGGIDISCGAITGLSCMVLALLQRDTDVNFFLTLIIAVVVSVICGLVNGIIVYEFPVPAMIATLGTDNHIWYCKDYKRCPYSQRPGSEASRYGKYKYRRYFTCSCHFLGDCISDHLSCS